MKPPAAVDQALDAIDAYTLRTGDKPRVLACGTQALVALRAELKPHMHEVGSSVAGPTFDGCLLEHDPSFAGFEGRE